MNFANVQNIVQLASDPGSPANGDVWYNTTSGLFKLRAGGVTRVIPDPAIVSAIGTGTVIDCSRGAGTFYGYPTAVTDATFTVNNTTAVLGGGAMIRYNRTTVPTLPANFTKRGTGAHVSGVNIICVICTYVDSGTPANNTYDYQIAQ